MTASPPGNWQLACKPDLRRYRRWVEPALLAHASQLHQVPDSLPDEIAVLVEPLACAVHAVRRIPINPGASVLVIGAGTVGLLTLLALRKLTAAGEVYVIAKYRHQADRARELGATQVIGADNSARALRRSTGALLVEPELGDGYLLGGVDVAFECTGGAAGLNTALRSLRAGGTVVASGMPAGGVDLTPCATGSCSWSGRTPQK